MAVIVIVALFFVVGFLGNLIAAMISYHSGDIDRATLYLVAAVLIVLIKQEFN